tara:strand:- start:1847 stop:2440 length:594 start_codon:yes stop_codon:yes gene_type:complete
MINKFDANKVNSVEIENYLNESLKIAKFQTSIINEIKDISNECINSLNDGGKLIFCGNGGSASDSQHLAAELIGRFQKDRNPIPAISLSTDTSVITAISNDYGFEFLFSKQIEALGNKEDVLFVITTSGKSKNIINALKKAKEMNLKTVSFSGINTESIKNSSDYIISIPSEVPGAIQQAHITIGQVICMNIENSMT